MSVVCIIVVVMKFVNEIWLCIMLFNMLKFLFRVMVVICM